MLYEVITLQRMAQAMAVTLECSSAVIFDYQPDQSAANLSNLIIKLELEVPMNGQWAGMLGNPFKED